MIEKITREVKHLEVKQLQLNMMPIKLFYTFFNRIQPVDWRTLFRSFKTIFGSWRIICHIV